MVIYEKPKYEVIELHVDVDIITSSLAGEDLPELPDDDEW